HNDQKVLVLAATNTPYALDQIRRQYQWDAVLVNQLDLKARQHMFKAWAIYMMMFIGLIVHLGDTPHNLAESDFEHLARKTEGFSGSDISVCVIGPTQDVMFFFRNPEDMWILCGPKVFMFLFAVQILPPPISRTDFDKVLARQRPTVSKSDLDVHE
ncbi:Vacuolar protein sorting-associated protein 4A, partial [Glycine soja]